MKSDPYNTIRGFPQKKSMVRYCLEKAQVVGIVGMVGIVGIGGMVGIVGIVGINK